MNEEYDFVSNNTTSNNDPINNGPVNNGFSNNNGPVNNGYSNNNRPSNNGGGVPLIAIIGVMALIIVGLIIYIIVDPNAVKDETLVLPETDEYQAEEIVEDLDEEPVIEDEEVVEDEEVIEDNKVVEDKKEETKTPIQTTTPSTSSANLSDDWKSCEFAIDGIKYKLNDSYSKYKLNGWYIDLEEMGYSNGYILNKNDKTYSTVDFYNDDFEDAYVSVGFINRDENAQDITECDIWAIDVSNSYADTPVNFELPGGLKNGSTLAEVEAAYGKPEEEDIYRSDDLGYTNYSYVYDYSIYLDLTIYDDEGLVEFDYKIYE